MRNEEIRHLHSLLQRVLWSVVWFVAINYFVQVGTYWNRGASFAWLGFLGVGVSIAGMALPWLMPQVPSRWYTDSSAAILTSMAFWHGWLNIHKITAERSDAAALNDFAVKLWSHGIDPYNTSLTAASATMGNPAAMWTYTLDGGHVSSFSYPAGALVFETPLRWLGVTHLTGSWFNMGAWIVATLVAYLLLPHSLRAIAMLVMLLGGAMALGGTSTDAAWMPFLMLGLFQWDRFGHSRLPWWRRYIGPVAIGLACSFKITPWFVVPFVLLGIYLETRHDEVPHRPLTRYALTVLAAFLVVNLPFIVLSPLAWLRGAVLPVSAGLIPGGQGLMSLVIHGDLPGVRTAPLALAGLAIVALAVFAYGRWYPSMKAGFVFLMPALFFIPDRSYVTYFESFFLVGVVAAATVASSTERLGSEWRPAWRRWPLIGGAAVSLALSLYSLFVPVLSTSVVSTSLTQGHWSQLTLRIANHGSHAVEAHVLVSVDDFHGGGFWSTSNGTLISLPANSTSTVVLSPAVVTAAPLAHQAWVAQVVTASPAWFGATAPRYGLGHLFP